MTAKNHPRIFIGFGEIAGFYGRLHRGFTEIGIESVFAEIVENQFNYQHDSKENCLISYCRKARAKFVLYRSSNKLLGFLYGTSLFFAKVLLLFWAIRNFDVFIFSGRTSFFHHIELPLLKIFGKKIVYIFLGSDSRPLYINGRTSSETYGISIEEAISRTAAMKKDIRKIEKYADVIVDHPPAGHFHEKPFVPFFAIGVPFAPPKNSEKEMPAQNKSDKIRIVHAPSFPECKGSDFFKQIIERMKNKGYQIDFVEIIDKPHAEVLRELAACDFVIDELYSDSTLAGLGTEAAFFSKPTVVGGYASIKDMINDKYIEMVPPALHSKPEDCEKTIEQLITDKEFRDASGKKGELFVKTILPPAAVAQRLLNFIINNVSEDHFFDPRKITYLHGWGLSEIKARQLVAAMIRKGGIRSLQLEDKPELEELFKNFASPAK